MKNTLKLFVLLLSVAFLAGCASCKKCQPCAAQPVTATVAPATVVAAPAPVASVPTEKEPEAEKIPLAVRK